LTRSHLLKRIEELRGSLFNAALKYQYDFLHPEVIKISQELDKYITQYTYLRSMCEL
jgi:hypothetical protein